MFFHESSFRELGLDQDTANLIAKVCNSIIDENALVVYGEYLQNGEAHNFSTEKKRTDSHVALLLGVEIMGKLKPREVPVKLDKPTKADIERFQAERITQLERELRLERSKQK